MGALCYLYKNELENFVGCRTLTSVQMKMHLWIQMNNTHLHIAGQKASEVLDVLKGYVDTINNSETATVLSSQNISVSGGNVQINIPNGDTELTARQIIYSEKDGKGE